MRYRFRTTDCPGANGTPILMGSRKWTLRIPIEGDGDFLVIEMGDKGLADLRDMIDTGLAESDLELE